MEIKFIGNREIVGGGMWKKGKRRRESFHD
jgi:hypothetical protein